MREIELYQDLVNRSKCDLMVIKSAQEKMIGMDLASIGMRTEEWGIIMRCLFACEYDTVGELEYNTSKLIKLQELDK